MKSESRKQDGLQLELVERSPSASLNIIKAERHERNPETPKRVLRKVSHDSVAEQAWTRPTELL
eukprot:3273732-Amphidinium_carterae.1